MTPLKLQRISGLVWIATIAIFFFSLITTPEYANEAQKSAHGFFIFGVMLLGGFSFIVMFIATLAYSINIKKEKKKIKIKNNPSTLFSTKQITLSPWFYVSLVLLIILVYILGKRSTTPVVQPNIIVQPPQQQPDRIIIQEQPAPQPRMKIENTNCYYIGDRLNCNTYSF